MIIKTAEFVISNTNPEKSPTTGLPEFAFIGRSNVGKSSLINMLVNRKNLAKTSSTPGKTQTINHFLINNAWYLVDLPGYGYASVGRTTKGSWPAMIETFLKKRDTLQNTFVLIDCRLEPQANDLDFVNWMGKMQLPFSLVFTKIDKISKGALTKGASVWAAKLKLTWEELPPVFFTSAEKKTGREELMEFIGSIIEK